MIVILFIISQSYEQKLSVPVSSMKSCQKRVETKLYQFCKFKFSSLNVSEKISGYVTGHMAPIFNKRYHLFKRIPVTI